MAALWRSSFLSLSRSWSDPPNYVDIDASYLVPGYSPYSQSGLFANDLALVHLTEPITSVTPAERYRGTDDFRGQLISKAGYGRPGTAATGLQPYADGVLRAGTNAITYAQYNFMYDKFDDPSRFGSTTLELQSSPGDSGGGWFNTQGQLIGIFDFALYSLGPLNYSYGAQSAAQRVSLFNNWIDSYVTTPVPGDFDGNGRVEGAALSSLATKFWIDHQSRSGRQSQWHSRRSGLHDLARQFGRGHASASNNSRCQNLRHCSCCF